MKMSEEIVRCPYCVLGSEFRPMFRQSRRRFACLCCGHTAASNGSCSNCRCSKCREMNRIASRCRSSHLRQGLVDDLPVRL